MSNPSPEAISAETPAGHSAVQKRKTYGSIQVLRAIAAYAVVLFHLKVLRIGYTGVDLFFVISGYIMGMVAIRETPLKFAYRRLTRIVPLYWMATLALCVLSLVPGLMRTFSFDMASLFKSLAFIPYFDRNGDFYPLLVPGWTLNFEIFFYLVFALAMLTPWPRRATVLVLAVLVAAGLILTPQSAPLQVYTNPLVLEFAAGLALSLLAARVSRLAGLASLMAGCLALAAMVAGITMPGDGLQRVLVAGLPCACVLLGVTSLEQEGFFPSLPLLVYLGDISYSLYLTHGFVLPVVEHLHFLSGFLLVTVASLASFALAALTYHGFERPVSRFFRKLENRLQLARRPSEAMS